MPGNAELQVYNIEQRGIEPVGGAARFASAMRQFRHEQPLVLFSGDCLNPSLTSAFTRGEQMVRLLGNAAVGWPNSRQCRSSMKDAHSAAAFLPPRCRCPS